MNIKKLGQQCTTTLKNNLNKRFLSFTSVNDFFLLSKEMCVTLLRNYGSNLIYIIYMFLLKRSPATTVGVSWKFSGGTAYYHRTRKIQFPENTFYFVSPTLFFMLPTSDNKIDYINRNVLLGVYVFFVSLWNLYMNRYGDILQQLVTHKYV